MAQDGNVLVMIERRVLGTVLMEGDSSLGALKGVLDPGDFSDLTRRVVYRNVLTLVERKETVDTVALVQMDETSDEEIVACLATAVEPIRTIQRYAKVIHDAARIRRYLESLPDSGKPEGAGAA